MKNTLITILKNPTQNKMDNNKHVSKCSLIRNSISGRTSFY